VQNMPGAGGLRAANYIYNVAAKDGTVFGTFARHIPLLGFIKSNQNVQFDPVKFTWLGSSSSYENDAYLLIVRRGAKIKSVEEAADRRLFWGARQKARPATRSPSWCATGSAST